MRIVVMPRVAYTGEGANLTEAQIKKLDSVTLAYARKDLHLLAGFPMAPLIHHQIINHSLPSSIYYEARLGSLWRNLGRASRPSLIIQEHLDRALQTRGMDPTVTQSLQLQDIQLIDGSSYWINGLFTGLQRLELYPHRGRIDIHHAAVATQSNPDGRDNCKRTAMGQHHVGRPTHA